MTQRIKSHAIRAAIAAAAILFSVGHAHAQASKQQAQDPYPKGYTPEAIADAALYAYIGGRSRSMLNFEQNCFDDTIQKVGKMMAGQVCRMVALANVAIDASQRPKDGLEPTPEFHVMESQLRFSTVAAKRGYTEDEIMTIHYITLRDGHARLLRRLEDRGIFRK